MVDAEEGEEGGVEVVEVDFVFLGVVAVVVGAAVDVAALHAAAGEPHGVTVGVVVAAVFALGGGGAAEFAAPEDEGVLQEAAAFEVFEEGGDGAVDFDGVFGVAFVEVAVLVPLDFAVAVGDLDEADAALGEAAGHEALAAEVGGDGVVEAVEFFGGGGFGVDVLGFGHGGLHAEGEFEAGDAAFEGEVGAGEGEVVVVQLGEEF